MSLNSEYVFNRYEFVSLAFSVEAGLLSAIAVLMIFLRIAFNIFRVKQRANPSSTWILIQVSLFLADIILSIAHIMNVHWIHSEPEQIVMGSFCIAQSIMMRLGSMGVVFNNLAIALHAFVVVWWRKGVRSLLAPKLVVAIIWVYITGFTAVVYGVGYRKPEVDHVQMPFRCWTPTTPMGLLLAGIGIWYFVTVIFSVLSYVLLYLCSQGIIAGGEEAWWKVKIINSGNKNGNEDRRRSLSLLLYPLGIIILFLPVIITQIVRLSGATGISMRAIFSLCGLYDALIFIYARQGLLVVKEDADLDMGRLPQTLPGGDSWHLPTNVPLEGEK